MTMFEYRSPEQQPHQRGLSAACFADDRDIFAGFDLERHIIHDIRRMIVIPETHIVQLNASCQRADDFPVVGSLRFRFKEGL